MVTGRLSRCRLQPAVLDVPAFAVRVAGYRGNALPYRPLPAGAVCRVG